jgi:hypothetical protein
MKKQITSKQYFQTVTLVYWIQAFSLLLFSSVIYFLIVSGSKSSAPATNAAGWSFALPVVLLIALASSYFLFRYMVKGISPKLRLQEKMPKYASAILIRSALIQLPGLFAALVAFMTFEVYYLGGSLMMVLVFLVLRPSKQTAAEDLQLSQKERTQLDNPVAVISEVGEKS